MPDECIDWRSRAIAAEALVARLELLAYADRPSVGNAGGMTWKSIAERATEELRICRNAMPLHVARALYEGEG